MSYAIDGVDETWQFTVPAKGAAPRMAYVSCNGFSDPGGMRKLIKAENAVWADLLCNHDRQLRPADYALDREQLWHEAQIHDQGGQRFHLMLMGGDQIYFDSIWKTSPLKRWIGLTRDEQLRYPVDAALEREIEDYPAPVRRPLAAQGPRALGGGATPLDAAQAMARMPTVMMWDDHDIFDGWGSYSPEMQRSPCSSACSTMPAARSGVPDAARHRAAAAVDAARDVRVRTTIRCTRPSPGRASWRATSWPCRCWTGSRASPSRTRRDRSA